LPGARLDVSLLGLDLLFFNDFPVRQPVKSWSRWSCLDFFVRLGNISFAGAWPSEQRQPTTFQSIRTALVSSNMNITGTKTFTSEWVLFGRLIIIIII